MTRFLLSAVLLALASQFGHAQDMDEVAIIYDDWTLVDTNPNHTPITVWANVSYSSSGNRKIWGYIYDENFGIWKLMRAVGTTEATHSVSQGVGSVRFDYDIRRDTAWGEAILQEGLAAAVYFEITDGNNNVLGSTTVEYIYP